MLASEHEGVEAALKVLRLRLGRSHWGGGDKLTEGLREAIKALEGYQSHDEGADVPAVAAVRPAERREWPFEGSDTLETRTSHSRGSETIIEGVIGTTGKRGIGPCPTDRIIE
jgi:hypothetical protein